MITLPVAVTKPLKGAFSNPLFRLIFCSTYLISYILAVSVKRFRFCLVGIPALIARPEKTLLIKSLSKPKVGNLKKLLRYTRGPFFLIFKYALSHGISDSTTGLGSKNCAGL